MLAYIPLRAWHTITAALFLRVSTPWSSCLRSTCLSSWDYFTIIGGSLIVFYCLPQATPDAKIQSPALMAVLNRIAVGADVSELVSVVCRVGFEAQCLAHAARHQ